MWIRCVAICINGNFNDLGVKNGNTIGKKIKGTETLHSSMVGVWFSRRAKKSVLKVLKEALWFWFMWEKRQGTPINLKEIFYKWLKSDKSYS